MKSIACSSTAAKVKGMGRKVFYYSFLSFLLMAAVSGCAGLPGKGTVAPGPSRAEIKLMETNRALDAVNEQSSAFYAQLNEVVEEIAQFRSRPYWEEFEQILLTYPSLRDPDDETGITAEMESRLSEWGAKWKKDWKEILEEYLSLVDKCTMLEAKRLAARERLLAVQAGYLAIVVMKASAGREKEGKEIYSVVEALDKSGAELDSYQPDDLGLYKSR
jgi:hypothetical protein